MQEVYEITDFIRDRVAAFKALPLTSVDVDAPLLEEIGLIGDDFSELDYLLCKRYGVETSDADYARTMSIRDWAGMILAKVDASKSPRI